MDPVTLAVLGGVLGILVSLIKLWQFVRDEIAQRTRMSDAVDRIDKLVSHNFINHNSEPVYVSIAKLKDDVAELKRH